MCSLVGRQFDENEPNIDSEDMDTYLPYIHFSRTYCPADCAPGPSHDAQLDSIVERIPQNEAFSEVGANPDNLIAEDSEGYINLCSEDDSNELNMDEAYAYLTGIFPNADPLYLRCSAEKFKNEHDVRTFVADKLESNDYPLREQFLAKVIKVPEEHQRYTKNFNVEPEGYINLCSEDDSMELNMDEAYDYLTGIFPNADPLYLRSSAEKFKNENDVRTFVADKLESNDYPLREQYLAKIIKVPEQQQHYTENFNVEQFLTLFPNPFRHFEDETRKCKYSLIVLEFLKNEFRGVRVNTINKIYRSSKFNMSIAAKNLRHTTELNKKPRCPRQIRTEDIPMLQEMAFVRHRRAIRKLMEAVKQKEEAEFNSLKAAGGLLACECCYDDECIPSKCSTCDNAHVFCNSCVINGTNSKLGDGETHVPCFLNCGSEFSMSTLQKVLPQTKFNILFKKRQAAEVTAAGLEGLVSCPFCHFALIQPEGDKVFKCLNPECMKESCILCKELNHIPLKCEEQKKKDKARKYIEEKMTQALTRTCYKCKRVFFKEEGCHLMTCLCGAKMCYICNKPVENYQHFSAQGSDEVGKCQLWSDTMRLNAETVRKVEEEARREVLRQEPTMDINTTGLAPALPPPTARPL